MRVLVTGASGLVGREVVARLLTAGHVVHGVGRSPRGPAGVEWHRADLLSAEGRRTALTAARVDVVVHLAWETQHGEFWTAPSNLTWVGASLDLARQAVEFGVSRFVGVGSWVERAEEGVPAVPSTLYSAAKHATNNVLARFFAGSNVSFAWARLFNVFGRGEPPDKLLSAAVRARLAGLPFVPREPGCVYDFIDARDAAAILASAATGSITGTFDVGSGRGRSVAQALAQLDAVLDGTVIDEMTEAKGASIADAAAPVGLRPFAQSLADLAMAVSATGRSNAPV